jgi:phage portal protein BeeE
MRVPAVAAAVELIATAIGTLPVKVYKLTNSHEVLKLNRDDLP